MKRGNLSYTMALLLLTAPLLVACFASESASHALLLPVGRSAVVGGNTFQVLIDSEPYDPQATYDNYGGYWAEIPYDPQKNREVLLQITIEDEQPGLYREESEDLERWLSPSELIDSDNPALIAEAEELAVDAGTAVEKARSIQDFVIRRLEFRIYRDHFRYSASDTYEMGYGTCVNYARLFVALCRAANVPARTVWGIIYGDGVYDYHHEWAEFLDDDGYWHPLDLTFTTSFDLSDIRYLDLIYSSEENPLYEQSRGEQYSADVTQVIVYDTTDQPYDGRLGFRLVEDNSPVSYVVENLFIVADIPSLIPQQVP
jgi:transglutaminase-like putative cysteine protease